MYRSRNNTQKIQKHRVHKMENTHTNQENKQKRALKTASRVIRKQQRETVGRVAQSV